MWHHYGLLALFTLQCSLRASDAVGSRFSETEAGQRMKRQWSNTYTIRNANERGPGWNPSPQRSFADRWNSTDSDRGLADLQITCWSCANASDSLAARAKIMPTWMKGWMSWSQLKPMLRLWSGRLLCLGFYELKQGSYLHYCYYLWWTAPCCLELLYIRAGWSYTSAFWPAFLSTSVGR